jgi:hypothetical protein
MQTPEQNYLESRKQARGAQDSPSEQPENTEAVDVSEDAPVEEVIEPEAIANDEVTPETEEPAEEVTAAQANDEEADLFYLDLDGEEVSSIQLKEWKANGLMQADYTRKTQTHAEDVKTFKAEKDDFAAKQSEFDNKLAQLNAMIEEDTPSAETLADWREYEPEKYIEHTEKMSNRKKLLAESKAELPVKGVDMVKVSADLFASHPEWMVDGKQSKQFTEDTNLMNTYAESRGIGQAEMVAFDARHYEIILDAARYKSQNNKNVAIAKKVRMAPVSTKPRAKANNSVQDELKIVQNRFNKTGNDKDFLLLRKLQRQLK